MKNNSLRDPLIGEGAGSAPQSFSVIRGCVARGHALGHRLFHYLDCSGVSFAKTVQGDVVGLLWESFKMRPRPVTVAGRARALEHWPIQSDGGLAIAD